MKRCYIIILVCLGCVSQSYAQLWKVSEDIYQVYDYGKAQYKTVDSTKYSYDQNYGRGSSRNNDTIRYDHRRKYKINTAGVEIIESFTQNFYPDGQIQTTTRQGIDTTNNKWRLFGIDSFYITGTFLKQYTMSELLHNGPGYAMYPTRKTTYTYDNDGNLTSAVSQTSYAFSYVWTNSVMYRYGYVNGKLVADSFFSTGTNQAWVLDYVSSYDYNAGGEILSKYRLTRNFNGGMDTFSRVLYVNNGQGYIDTATTEFYNAGQWNPILHTVYTYHPNGDVHTDLKISPGSSQPYNSAYRYIYNQYGHLAEREYEQYNKEKNRHIYTYEHYWPASISTASDNGVAIQIAPIPSSDIITIQARFANETKVQVTIVDVQARIVMQWQDTLLNNNYHKQVPVGQLSPGMYFIIFDTSHGKVDRQFLVK